MEPTAPKVRVQQGPRLPRDTQERLRPLFVGPQPSQEVMTNAILSDPALACQFLKFANAPGRRTQEGFSTISRAVAWLGLVPLQTFFRRLCERQAFDDVNGFGAEMTSHSLATSVIARFLADTKRDPEAELVELFALLHDVGVLLCIQDLRLDYRTLEPTQADHRRLHLNERRVLGFDHAKVGWHALNVWGIPEPLPTLVAWHHQGSRAYSIGGIIGRAVAYLRASEDLVHSLRELRAPEPRQLRPLIHTEPMRQLGIKFEDLVQAWPALVSQVDSAYALEAA